VPRANLTAKENYFLGMIMKVKNIDFSLPFSPVLGGTFEPSVLLSAVEGSTTVSTASGQKPKVK
jgi:hypothetical protein